MSRLDMKHGVNSLNRDKKKHSSLFNSRLMDLFSTRVLKLGLNLLQLA